MVHAYAPGRNESEVEEHSEADASQLLHLSFVLPSFLRFFFRSLECVRFAPSSPLPPKNPGDLTLPKHQH